MHEILDISDITDAEMEYEKERLLLYMFPNQPRNADEDAILEKAALYQAAHDRKIEEQAEGIPKGTTSFQIGHFSMQMGEDFQSMSDRLTRKTICSAAYSLLLRAGLLYKGVERIWDL